MKEKEFIEGIDYVLLNGKVIMTEKYLKERGHCCGNNCLNCPYDPRATKGTKTINKKNDNSLYD